MAIGGIEGMKRDYGTNGKDRTNEKYPIKIFPFILSFPFVP